MRPLLIGLTLLLLVVGALATGVIAADWPFWQRAWRWHSAAPGLPERLPGAHAWIEAQGEPRDLETASDPAITAAASRLLADEGTLALLVARGDRVLFEYYGANGGPGTRIDGRELTVLPLVLLYGAAQARATGPGLDAAVAALLPEWREDPRGLITARQLLQNLSGLESADGTPLNPFGDTARLASGPNFERAALGFGTAWPPGSHFEPNPADAQLAATLLVRATGQPLTTLLRDWLVQPLGFDSVRVLLDRHRGAMAAHCCMQARARDWLGFALLLAQQGRLGGRQVVPSDFVEQIGRGVPVAPEHGLGVELVTLPGGGQGLLAAGRGRLLLADPGSGSAWLWYAAADFDEGGRASLLAAAAEAARGQARP